MPQTAATSTAQRDISASRNPVVMCAADDAYVMPLAVTMQTAAEHLATNRRLTVYVVDTGITESNWEGLRESLAVSRVDLIRIPFDTAPLRHLNISHHISHTAYARLLAARLLPSHLDRVIYLDSDLLVNDDLAKLWEIQLDGAVCAAVPDIACPYIDARRAPCDYRKCGPYLACPAPIKNWRTLGIDPAGWYFNSGVMVIDLVAWRNEDLAGQFLNSLQIHSRHVWCWDQYALNVVLANRWRRLAMRWNLGSHAFEYPSLYHAPVDGDEFVNMMGEPAIIHFTTEFKPWHFGSEHPKRSEFFSALQKTAWSDWQPQRPDFSLHRIWQRWMVALVKRTTFTWRKVQGLTWRPSTFPTPAASEVETVVNVDRSVLKAEQDTVVQ